MFKVVLSWIFYYAGDLFSKMVWGEGRWADVMFFLYQWTMRMSDKLQGDDDRGPWSPVVTPDNDD